jgi:hypothetical protein
LAYTSGRPLKHRLVASASVVFGLLVLLLLASFADSPRDWFPVAVLLLSLGLLVAGVFLVAESARAPRELCQGVAALTVCLLMSTLFWLGPIIRAMAERSTGGDVVYRRITLMMDVNPFFVMAYSVFDQDLLHTPFFYRMGLADYQRGTPSWGLSSAGFAITGLILAAVATGVRRAAKP